MASLASGCTHLPFTTDTRLHFLSPNNGASVQLPVTVTWRFADGEQAQDYAVFVDGTPMAPRATVRSVTGADHYCPGSARPTDLQCLAYLRQHGVYLTAQPTLTINDIAPRVGDFTSEQLHDVTVVLLGADGRRLGESSWTIQLHVKGPA